MPFDRKLRRKAAIATVTLVMALTGVLLVKQEPRRIDSGVTEDRTPAEAGAAATTTRDDYAPLHSRSDPADRGIIRLPRVPGVTDAVAESRREQTATSPLPKSAESPPMATNIRNKLTSEAQIPLIDQKNLCRTNLAAIVWAANMWAARHRERFLPLDFALLREELPSPAVLVCPADPLWEYKARTNWQEFNLEWISYRFHPSAMANPNQASVNVSFNYLSCPIHKLQQLGDRPSPPGGWWVFRQQNADEQRQ
jgi:hypothetical protein